MNFIKAHLVSSIKRLYKDYETKLELDTNRFLYLDEPVESSKKKINRINSWYPYALDEVVNSGWHELKGSEIKEIWNRIKSNKVYVIKNIGGKFYKIRKKDAV
jgi:hypothetical protein